MVRGRHDQEGRMAGGAGLDAPITGVTVFKEGARVQRGGVVNLEPGLWPVVIGNLPATVDPGSGRIAARRRDLALLNAEVHRRYRADPLRGETARLRSEVERWRDAVRRLTMGTRHRPQLGGTHRRQNWPLRGAVWT
jgi:hypothetical protein